MKFNQYLLKNKKKNSWAFVLRILAHFNIHHFFNKNKKSILGFSN